MNEQDKTALLDQIDDGLAQLGPSRPSADRVTKARTIFKGVRVACQNIPISPATTDGGAIVVPPTPGPETPPVDPAPPETPPSGGGGGGSTSPPTTTTVVTTYTSNGDFNGTQGYRGWYYLSEDGTQMTYSSGAQLWSGTETYQGIWSTGQHPGSTNGAMRRWVAQATGTFAITGQIFDADTGTPSDNVTVTVKKNGVAIYGPQTIVAGDTTGYSFSAGSGLTGNCTAADTFDFLVKGVGGIAFCSTGLTASISVTTTTTSGGGTTTQTTLPFTLNGTAPEEGTYTISANKPSNADGCTIAITGVNYAASYGRIYFNGSTNSMAIWPTAPGNAGISATVTLTVPVAYMVNGSNALRFTHDSGSGYTVTAIGTPTFTTPATPTPPATQTSLPFDLRGVILPEDAILTVSLSKPSNASGATMTITGVNLTETQGSYYINGTLASAIWTSVPANAGVSASVIRTPDVNLFQNGNNAIRFTHTEGAGYTVSSVNVIFTTPSPADPPVIPPPGTGTWPQLPSNATVLLNHAFDTVTAGGMTGGIGNGGIRADASAPLSPSNCAMSRLEVGTNQGGSQIEFYVPAGNRYQELYCGLYWRTNPQWTGRATNDKMFFLRGDNSNGYFGLLNGITKGGGNPRFFFGHNSGNVDNSHIMSLDLGLQGNSNVSSSEIIPGQWTRIEVQLRVSTTLTSRDGIVRWWVNGVLCGNYTTLNYGTTGIGLTNWIWTETWDGSGVPVHPVPLEHWIDHVIVAGRN